MHFSEEKGMGPSNTIWFQFMGLECIFFNSRPPICNIQLNNLHTTIANHTHNFQVFHKAYKKHFAELSSHENIYMNPVRRQLFAVEFTPQHLYLSTMAN